ncbi:site-specific integrase, partial [Escherichia coli]|nr:site-specific integrase [Escherichia coli]
MLLGAHAGLRASEVSRLERSHLHFHDGTVFVAESKGKKSRSVAVSKSLQQALEQYLETLPAN